MIEALYRRKHCRDFLRMYSEQLYKELIPDIFEIGVLTLLNSFNKYNFTKEELNDIILDLKNKEYIQNPEIKSLQKLPLTKPLTFSQEEEKQFRKYDGNFSKKEDEIYPNWWWNVKETRPKKNEEIQTIDYYPEDNYQPFYNNNNMYNTGYNSLMYSSPNLSRENYFNSYNNNFNNNYNEYYNNNLINQGNYLNQRQMYDYPRRRMIMNTLSKGKKKRNKNKHHSHSYHYKKDEKEKNIQSNNQNNQNLKNQENNKIQNNQRNPPKKKISYKISYDKELKPEKIEKSGKEIDPSYSYYQGNIQKTTSSNNNNNNNNNNYNNEIQNPQNNLATSQNSNNNQLSSMNISDETRNAIQNNFRESTVSSNMNNQNYQNSQNNFNNSNNEYYNQQY